MFRNHTRVVTASHQFSKRITTIWVLPSERWPPAARYSCACIFCLPFCCELVCFSRFLGCARLRRLGGQRKLHPHPDGKLHSQSGALFRFRNKIEVVTRHTGNSGRLLKSGAEVMPSETCKKTYASPKLNKLTPEQASLILIGHASCGHQGAKDLLAALYPSPERGSHSDWMDSRDEYPAQMGPEPSGLIHRALTAFQSTREDFWRFVRG